MVEDKKATAGSSYELHFIHVQRSRTKPNMLAGITYERYSHARLSWCEVLRLKPSGGGLSRAALTREISFATRATPTCGEKLAPCGHPWFSHSFLPNFSPIVDYNTLGMRLPMTYDILSYLGESVCHLHMDQASLVSAESKIKPRSWRNLYHPPAC